MKWIFGSIPQNQNFYDYLFMKRLSKTFSPIRMWVPLMLHATPHRQRRRRQQQQLHSQRSCFPYHLSLSSTSWEHERPTSYIQWTKSACTTARHRSWPFGRSVGSPPSTPLLLPCRVVVVVVWSLGLWASQNSTAAPVMPWPCKGEEECISGLVCCCCQKIWEYPANPEESVPCKQAMNMCLYPVCGQRLCVLHFYCCPWPKEEVEEAEGDLVCSLSSTLQSLLQVVLVHQNT